MSDIANMQELGAASPCSQSVLSFQRKTSKDILEICKPLFNSFNLTLFSHTRAFHNGCFTSLMTTVELTEYYIDHKYPIYFSQGKGLTLETGIYIAAHLESSSHQKIRQELKNLFNVDHMVHIIDKQSTYDDMYSFATTPENYQLVNELINNMDVIKHFILYYKDKTAGLIKKATKVKYSDEYFSLPKGTRLFNCMPNSYQHKSTLKHMIIKRAHVSTPFGEVCLSKREFDCLKYAVKNYTFKEIGKFLNLSPRTVETYVNNLKYKLKCDTRAQLVDNISRLDLF
jgi:DNA-binding CsgD family transcriptional regulator